MKLGVRICLYVILLVMAVVFFGRFRQAYRDGPTIDRTATLPVTPPDPVATPSPTAESTPAGEDSTNVVETSGVTTNEVSTNAVAELPVPPDGSLTSAETTSAQPPGPKASSRGNSLIHLGIFVLALLGLGGLGAWDIARYLGTRAGRSVMAEDWVERRDPEYEEAEEEWARGNHLDAIGLMREYLKKNPSEQHVALRIAEIYEKDLGNFLAAALEIEEVLTKKLPREKWGWTAIHLSNLYSGRLAQADKALALLQRVVSEYPDTGAARKARQRLGLPDPETEVTEEPENPASPPSDSGTSSLPRGFRPKK